MPIRKVLYTAAHGGFAGQAVPLGGGAAVSNWLVEEWTRTAPFEFELVSPAILGPRAPGARDIVRFSERDYARFCRDFERAATERVLREDPQTTAVLVNDISEAPDFLRLQAAGFRIVTIYHVDVVAYIAAIYLRGWMAPERLVRLHGWFGRWWPDILQLIFDKQRASVQASSAIVVPSSGMKQIIERCYGPQAPVQVVPWGARAAGFTEAEIQAEAERLRAEFRVPAGVPVLITLSRISPEKGQDDLLRALRSWQGEAVLLLCGEAAFMQGQKFERKLRRLASELKNVRVIFPGYVTGLRKAGFFRLADVYCFPSKHESYGLTLMEAIDAGCPVVCADHSGSREIARPEWGEVARPPEFCEAIRRQLGRRRPNGQATPRFEQAAARIAELLRPA